MLRVRAVHKCPNDTEISESVHVYGKFSKTVESFAFIHKDCRARLKGN